jgi:stage II sporulation SpoE-like protein
LVRAQFAEFGRVSSSEEKQQSMRSPGFFTGQSKREYFSLPFRQRPANSSDVAEITLMSPGDTLFLYTDGIYDGSDAEDRGKLEAVMREHCLLPAKDICNVFLDFAVTRDDRLRETGEEDRIDDKTVFIIKRS